VRVLDLTYSFSKDTVYWPTGESFERKDVFRGKTDAGFFYAAGQIAAAEHGGTHMDAPSHFAEKGHAAEDVSPSSLVGPAWILDVREECAKDPDHLVSVDDFMKQTKPMPPGAIVLVLTGWGRYWPHKRAYLGDDRPGKADELRFPGIDPKLAAALAARHVRAVGIDTASIDRGSSKVFESHQIFAAQDIPTFENVANLDALLFVDDAWIVASPMKIENGTGAPLRLYALAPREFRVRAVHATKEAGALFSSLVPTETSIGHAEGSRPHAHPPIESDLWVAFIEPTFLDDGLRAADLLAALERAAFYVEFVQRDATAWKAPRWPYRPHHDLERGTPEERMARYEEPGRDEWQKPDEVVKALALPEDAVTVDVGVGSGYFARRLAKATPRGKAIGLDIEATFVEHVNAQAKELALPNLEARLVAPDDPGLAPASVDLVLIVDTYHHLGDRKAYLGKLKAALKPGGRIAIIDFKKDSKMGPPAEHKLSKEAVIEEARATGFELGSDHDLLPEQYFIELKAAH
jgi:kynurenine formamidase/SAM-dependent methyltransferase